MTLPPGRKAGWRAASASKLVSARGPSSVATYEELLLPVTSTGASSFAKRCADMAAVALRWLASAYASCSALVMPYSVARFSAVSPIASTP